MEDFGLNRGQLLGLTKAPYDPSGLISPVSTAGKLLNRKLALQLPNLSWRDRIPTSFYPEILSYAESVLFVIHNMAPSIGVTARQWEQRG